MRKFSILLAFLISLEERAQTAISNQQRGFDGSKTYDSSAIDSVNLFNGNLILSPPVTRAYVVSEALSYSTPSLVYNGNVWDYEERPASELDPSCACNVERTYVTEVIRPTNAGVGWNLSLGSFGADGAYLPGDGSKRTFQATLHSGESPVTDVSYSTDNSYLRLRNGAAANENHLEFPDGTIHVFDATTKKLSEIRDRFGNWVRISYSSDSTYSEIWTISDMHSRNHYVRFRKIWLSPENVANRQSVDVVAEIDTAAFGNLDALNPQARAVTRFEYVDTAEIKRSCRTNDPLASSTVIAPLLKSITLPDGTAYQFVRDNGEPAYYATGSDQQNAGDSCGIANGHLSRMQLPTLGRVDWTWQAYGFPNTSGTRPYRIRAPGIHQRTLTDPTGRVPAGTWTYTTTTGSNLNPEMVNTVRSPSGETLENYFNVCAGNSQSDCYNGEYGLASTRVRKTTPVANPAPFDSSLFLSTVFRDAAGNILRSTYRAFEGDVSLQGGDDSSPNRRLRAAATVFESDTGCAGKCRTSVSFSNFDGLGHYRDSLAITNFPGSSSKRNFVAWNTRDTNVSSSGPNSGTFPGSFTMLQTTDPWILNTFTSSKVTEGTETNTTLSYFDRETGALLRTRRLASKADYSPGSSSTLGTSDIVTINDLTAGNVTATRSMGGDRGQLASAATALSGITPSGGYLENHTISRGIRTKTSYSGASSFTHDVDIDANTGLLLIQRDSAGVATGLRYDNMNRLVYKSFTGGGWTQIVHSNASGSVPARTEIIEGLSTSPCSPPAINLQPAATTTISPGTSVTLTADASGTTPISWQWYLGSSGNTTQPIAGATTSSLTRSPSQTEKYWARASNSCGIADTITATIVVNSLTAPTNLVASAPTANSIAITWTAVSGATRYDLERSVNNSVFTVHATPAVNSFTDTSVLPGNTYVYRVLAKDDFGSASPASNKDIATTVAFLDDPIPAGTIILATHFREAREAVDAVRKSAGLTLVPWTDPSLPGVLIRATHMQELRSRLNEARSTIGVPPQSFIETVSVGTPVSRSHVEEIRTGVK